MINQDHDHDYDVKLPAPEVEPKKPAKQPVVEGNKKITEFFTVRRSVRKTKKEVQAERMRTLEQAILEEKEEGLEVRIFEIKIILTFSGSKSFLSKLIKFYFLISLGT